MDTQQHAQLEARRYLDSMSTPSLKKIIDKIIVEAFEDLDKRDELMSMYSDVYKEKHGIRPRWMMSRMADMSVEQIEMELDKLMDEPDSEDYDVPDFAEPGSDEPLAVIPNDAELDDPHDTLPKQAGMGRDAIGRDKRTLQWPNSYKKSHNFHKPGTRG